MSLLHTHTPSAADSLRPRDDDQSLRQARLRVGLHVAILLAASLDTARPSDQALLN